ncbi:MAG TPA: hypothetical protein VFZ78_00235 [Flavisolibacter sp.]
MRILIILLLTACCLGPVRAQNNLHGSWYAFMRNHIVEFKFSGDTLFSRALDWDLQPVSVRPGSVVKNVVQQTDTAGGRVYASLINNEKRSRSFAVFEFSKSGNLMIFISSKKRERWDTTTLLGFAHSDTLNRIGLYFMSSKEIERFSKLRPLDSMTSRDIVEYANRYAVLKRQLDDLDNSGKRPASGQLVLLAFYTYRLLFAEVGYNPMVPDEAIVRLFRKFKKNRETRDLVKSMDLYD